MAYDENIEFDSFQPFQRLNFASGQLLSKKTILYYEGMILKDIDDYVKINLQPKVSDTTGKEVLICNIDNDRINKEIHPSVEFDIGFTNSDRFMFVNIPENTNIDCPGILGLKAIVGNTRAFKDFDYKSPYCLSIFFLNQKMFKVAFSYCGPERVLEFFLHQEYNSKPENTITLEEIIVQCLIEDYDSDGAVFNSQYLIDLVKNKFESEITIKDIESAVERINSLYPNSINKNISWFRIGSRDYMYESQVSKQELLKIIKVL